MTIRQIDKFYGGRIRQYLRRVASAMKKAGYKCGPVGDTGVDEYKYGFLVEPNEKCAETVDVGFEIVNGADFDGTGGVNFGLSAVAEKGRVIAAYFPYNFTPEVWVDLEDNNAVEHRLDEALDVSPESIIEAFQIGQLTSSTDKVRVGRKRR